MNAPPSKSLLAAGDGKCDEGFMDGILIAVEGIDGAGKTTQVELLHAALTAASEDVVVSKEPTDSVWGKKIRQSALTERMSLADELYAFLEDRKLHVAELIEPALEAGKIVILDRYFYSTIAYQGARGAKVEDLVDANLAIAPVPDVVLLVDIDPEISIGRIRGGRGETPDQFEGADYLRDVRKIFLQLDKSRAEISRFDGTQSIEQMQQAIGQHLIAGVLAKKRAGREYEGVFQS